MMSRPASLPTLAGLALPLATAALPPTTAALPPTTAALPPIAAALPRFALGLAAVDARLGGGLAVAALHELYGQTDADASSVAAFALLLAQRCGRPGPILWLREDRAARHDRPYGLGLVDLGLDPARLVLVQAPDTLALLRAGAEAVACAALAVVLIEPYGRATAFDLTASRRFMLAAARSGVLALALRSGDPVPSAAQSRWQIAAAPSSALAADAPGAPAFAVTLLRHRSGIAGFSTRMEWDRDSASFTAPRPGALPAAAPLRTVAAPAPGRRQRAA
jgi:protein ImuA